MSKPYAKIEPKWLLVMLRLLERENEVLRRRCGKKECVEWSAGASAMDGDAPGGLGFG